jgi:hypothetical protein
MPFKKIYEVNFSHGNLSPQINSFQWPQMHLMASDNDLVEQFPEPLGMNLRITRGLNVSPEVTNSVVVSFPDPLPLSSRIQTHVSFDLPRAGGIAWMPVPSYENEKGEENQSQTDHSFSIPRNVVEEMGGGAGIEPGIAIPEPWGVALHISNKDHLLDSKSNAVVSCQFHRKGDQSGVRLNTSLSLQSDQSYYLESPLNYQQYQAGFSPNVNAEPSSDQYPIHPISAPIFLLEHSFCGFEMENQNHFPGCGFLTICMAMNHEVRTHRVYSANKLHTPTIVNTNSMNTNSIKALGVNLSTLNGRGWMSIRLRSFEVWMDIDHP